MQNLPSDRNSSKTSHIDFEPNMLETQTVKPGELLQVNRGWGSRLIGLCLLIAAFGSGWVAATVRHDHQRKEELTAFDAKNNHVSSSVTVTVEPVTVRSVQRTVEAMGTLHGFEEVSISARIEGRVRKVFHDVADRVKPAQLLLEIDPTDNELSVQQSERALQVELAKLGLKKPPDTKLDLQQIPVVSKAKAMMEHAKSRQERINRLAATKNVSAEESEAAVNDYRTTQAEYENQIIQAEADLATIQMKQVELLVAQEQLANTKVLAPTPTFAVPENDEITYVISHRSVSEGTLVRPGTEIFRVVISQILKLRVPVPERHSSEIQRDQIVQVFTAASHEPFPGSVTRIYPIVEPTTRTFQVEIQVPNASGSLKPGSFAKAAILTRVDPSAVTVPLTAVVQFAGITKIFLAEKGLAKEIPVTLGTQTADWVEIVKPTLPSEALVITSGQTAIADETPVIVRAAEAKLAARRTFTRVDDRNPSDSESMSQGVRE